MLRPIGQGFGDQNKQTPRQKNRDYYFKSKDILKRYKEESVYFLSIV